MAEENKKGVRVDAVSGTSTFDLFYEDANLLDVRDDHLFVIEQDVAAVAVFAPGQWLRAERVQ